MSAIALPGARRLTFGVVFGPAGVTMLAVLSVAAFGGWKALLASLAGAAIAWVTILYARRLALVPGRSLGGALGRVLIGESVKVISTIVLFAAAARVPHVSWPALLVGFAVSTVNSWRLSPPPR